MVLILVIALPSIFFWLGWWVGWERAKEQQRDYELIDKLYMIAGGKYDKVGSGGSDGEKEAAD
jgi:hypothetical protein